MRDELKRRELLRRTDPVTRLLAGLEGKKVAMVFVPADGAKPVNFTGTVGEVEIPEGAELNHKDTKAQRSEQSLG